MGQALLHGQDMLLTLVRNEGNTVTKEALYEEVWNRQTAGDARAALVQLSRLRAKLEPVENEGIHLAVLRGEGVRFPYLPTK